VVRIDFTKLQSGGKDLREVYPLCFREPDEPLGDTFFKRSGGQSWTGRRLTEALPLIHAIDIAYAVETAFTVIFDLEGFRNTDALTDWDVVVVGDSFTESGYLPFGQIFTSVAAKKSKQRVKNLGACHTGPLSHIEFLKRFASAPSHRHAVLAFFEGNYIRDAEREAVDLNRFRETGARHSREIPPQTSLIKAIWQTTKAVVKRKLSIRYPNAIFTAAGKNLPATTKAPPLPEDPETLTAEQRAFVSSFLDGWSEAAQAKGMEPSLLYIPSNPRTYHGLVSYEPNVAKEPREWTPTDLPAFIQKLCHEKGIAFIDASPALRSAAGGGTQVSIPFSTRTSTQQVRALSASRSPQRSRRRCWSDHELGRLGFEKW
jgi:hypothetical protein